MFTEFTREAVFAAVWAVVFLRTPAMIRDRRQRPLWLVLIVIALGSITIQSWLGSAVNHATGVAQFNNLLQGLYGVIDIAVVLEFVVHLTGRTPGYMGGRVATRASWALLAAIGMSVSFACTPPASRFEAMRGLEPFAGFVLLLALYLLTASAMIVWMLALHLHHVKGKLLYAALLMVALGSAAEIPLMIVRTFGRWERFSTHDGAQTAFLFSTTRFILIPAGCVLVVLGPIVVDTTYRFRHARLYPLWQLLRTATAELAPVSPEPLVAADKWEQLHRRVVEIRDSSFYLLDRWSWPGLLEHASRHARTHARTEQQQLTAVACGLEVTRRLASTGRPPFDKALDKTLLPEIRATRSTVRAETRYLLRLHRAIRSRRVRDFAEVLVAELERAAD